MTCPLADPKWPELAKSWFSLAVGSLAGDAWTRLAAHGGAVAQLGERRNRTAEVRGSNPLGSTSLRSLRELRLAGSQSFASTSNRFGSFRAGYSAACWAPNGDQWVLCNREITAQMR